MEVNVNRPLLESDPSAKSLIEGLEQSAADLGLGAAALYYNFPLYRDVDDSASRVHALLADPSRGIIIFECDSLVPSTNSAQSALLRLAEQLDQSASQVVARLIKSKRLRRGPQQLKMRLYELIFLPNADPRNGLAVGEFDHIVVHAGFSQLAAWIRALQDPSGVNDDEFREAIAILEGSSGIISPRGRDLHPSAGRTRGKILRDIEVALALFDADQKRAAMNIIDGPQRVRGLAGSGKTIVLTWKAALIHLQNPEARIVYSYYTKSLYGLIKGFITRFYRHYAERDPDWDKVRVLHAWGGKNLPGVYSTICSASGIDPITFSDARGHGEDEFDYVCKKLLEQNPGELFDYMILDEGQDFPPSFYRLCYQVTRAGRVVWGYDECQNILDVEVQDPRETFGRHGDGKYLVDLSQAPPGVQNNIVLHRCYRNPRHILIYAFALGLGLYNDPILQMLENNDHWTDLGFNVLQGSSRVGDHMVIERPETNSPLIMNRLFGSSEEIHFEAFPNAEAEAHSTTTRILSDIQSELLPEDILVVSLDDRFARRYFNLISASLAAAGVRCFNLLEAPSNSRLFSRQGYVTLSTVYRAKGNEAGSVYVIGVDSMFAQKDSIAERNKLFSAMTRAKGWLSVTGCGELGRAFVAECERVKAQYPLLCFTMPNRERLRMFQRDLSEQQAQINRVERDLEQQAKKMGVSVERLIEMLRESTKRKKNGK